MAYRFLLEVPATLSDDANVAVATAGDAQVVVERPGHGLGFDEPYIDLTVAAHSLRVIDSLYGWASELGANRADSRSNIGIVLHDGARIRLSESDAPNIVAAIRRDQPWVERSVPKIGDHERVKFANPATPPQIENTSPASLAVATAPAATVADVDLVDAEDEITVDGTNYAVIRVMNLALAERFYNQALGLTLVKRYRQDDSGNWQDLGTEYDHAAASHTHTEADLTFMENGPLALAISRAGRAAHLNYDTVMNELQVAMEPLAASRLRALVLMRNYTLLGSAGRSFTFRDPFGVVWNIRPSDNQA